MSECYLCVKVLLKNGKLYIGRIYGCTQLSKVQEIIRENNSIIMELEAMERENITLINWSAIEEIWPSESEEAIAKAEQK